MLQAFSEDHNKIKNNNKAWQMSKYYANKMPFLSFVFSVVAIVFAVL